MTILDLYKRELFILSILFIIGFLVHNQSLQMVLYGDDWRFIYNYLTHEEIVANFSPLPGLLKYMAPYGPSHLTIGLLFDIFGKSYYIYYLVPLIFKILTAFVVFLILKNISKNLKKNDSIIVSFLSAALFLVGSTGIQAIDWAFHINVYIGIFIFALSLYFQLKFYNFGEKVSLLSSLFLSLLSILVAPFRLLCVVLMSPLIDCLFITSSKIDFVLKVFVLKNIVFLMFIFTFFLVGLFGHSPGGIYSPYPITESIKTIVSQPVLAAKTFFHWIGISIISAYPAGSSNSYLIGIIFIVIFLIIFYKNRNKIILFGAVLYFIPLILMWLVTPLRSADSGDKYLPLSFFGLSILIGIMTLYAGNLKNIFKVVLFIIVLMQSVSTIKIYSLWLNNGRSAEFTEKVHSIIISHFPTPITVPKVIYLDFDDGATQQSIEYGIGYRTAIFSSTKGLKYFPTMISSKAAFLKWLEKENKTLTENKVESISAFQYKDKKFTDVTQIIQTELRKEISGE